MTLPIVIETPTAVINESLARQHIRHMAGKAQRSGTRLRPHFKTHQSAAVGAWFRAEGVMAITVSSVSMARYFAAHGWDDITLAFPVNWLEIERINTLARQVRLGLLVESVETAGFLAERLAAPAQVWLKIDTGYHRTGIAWDDFERQRVLVAQIEAASQLSLAGLLTHAGHSYRVRGDISAIRAIYQETVERLNAARDALLETGQENLQISLGDTPCCSVVDDFSAVDEIRPGNFVFYDVMQVQIGACQETDIALAVACPVVAKHAADRRIVVYGGAVHLSKEQALDDTGAPYFGRVALPTPDGWSEPVPGCAVISLSQEHGIVRASEALFEQVQIGDVLMILPVHSCLAANLLRGYRTLSDEYLACGDFV